MIGTLGLVLEAKTQDQAWGYFVACAISVVSVSFHVKVVYFRGLAV